MLQSFPFSGAKYIIKAAGTYFLYSESTTAELGINDRVSLFINGVVAGTFRPGDWVRLPRNADTWEIVAQDPAAKGFVTIGTATTGSSRVVGQVEVLDGSLAKVLSGTEYIGYSYNVGSAGNIAHCGFRSFQAGVTISVRKLTVTSPSAFRSRIATFSLPGDIAPAVANPVRSKNTGLNIPSMSSYAWAEANEYAPIKHTNIATLHTDWQGTMQIFEFDTPIIINQGEGILVANATVGAILSATCEGSVISS